MTNQSLEKLVEKIAHSFELPKNECRLDPESIYFENQIDTIRLWLQKNGIILIENDVEYQQIKDLSQNNPNPFFYVNHIGELIFIEQKQTKKATPIFQWQTTAPIQLKPGTSRLFTFFKIDNIAQKKEQKVEHATPFHRLMQMLKFERKDILSIYVYAILIGTISLSLPLGIQAIIGLVQSGVFFSSIYILIGVVLLGLILSGVMQIMQLTIVEYLQERLFAKSAFEYTYRITNIKPEALRSFYPPELMNRFFDIITIQKTLPKILIDVTAASIQIIFGLLLLSAYHPLFIGFAILTVLLIWLVVRIYAKRLLDANIIKSKYKYKIAYWLQDIARMIPVFKLSDNLAFPIQKMEYLISNYLKYRKKYYNYLLVLFYNAVFFKVLVTGGLLILGTYLVIDLQITIGQFVASEIVIVLVVSSVEKILLSFDSIFDLLTAVDKIGHISDLPLEQHRGVLQNLNASQSGISVEVKQLKFKFSDGLEDTLRNIDLNIKASEKIVLNGSNGSGKETLLNILSGLLTNYQGMISYDGIFIKDIQQEHFFKYVKKNQSPDSIFDGTILENITLNRSFSTSELDEIMNGLLLKENIGRLSDGLQTPVVSGGRQLSDSFKTKIILARCLLHKPRLLILSSCFDTFSIDELKHIYTYIHALPCTLVIESNHPYILENSDRIIQLENGRILA